ncbi:hypothetical protein ADU59_03080 [Pararhizobium polonicum]|uniref:Uncharacterized protein n=1 Tax=Pararhizobium polonicum TaxID=1612624 RepID=A0A1C7P637_9HYPH|nr:hypothetical protein [Pararhizobium polonicum]OBZ96738.1 hypothetical protein ADU59_03080 [Pararhizobium polonicum]
MTRIEECFPPDIVRAVYARLTSDTEPAVGLRSDGQGITISNVVSLAAYRLKVIGEEAKVVS